MSPVNKGFAITTLWAFIAKASDDDEGVCGFRTSDGWLPMVASDRARADLLKVVAEAIAKESGQRIELRRWDGPSVVEAVWEP